ncbi:ribokinase [Enterococcus sp. CSURQ0835]|uniref:ribokinase n=1 Tax=Enterococcus sp. CSURQ0835 TaxID=2681394 RepID=UPI00135C3343|nr:ribokinase [Enterococcus sp. CSURQ0835]
MDFDVVVLGSINLDVKALVGTYPQHKDTSFAKEIDMIPGGKGSNQAVAVSKLGGKIAFLGAVGNDSAGNQMLTNLKKNGVDTSYIKISETEGTGTFLVMLDDNGDNTMVGTLGANDTLTAEDITQPLSTINAPVLLLQMETSHESIMAALKAAKEKEMFVILDPAPADGYFEEALTYADCVTPNQQETEKISGIKVETYEDAVKAAKVIHEKGAKTVIIKMGSEGNVVYQAGKVEFVAAHKVKAVDTIGAGDTFAGALAVHYAKHHDLIKAVEFANQAAAVKVSRTGGQSSIPTISELENLVH